MTTKNGHLDDADHIYPEHCLCKTCIKKKDGHDDVRLTKLSEIPDTRECLCDICHEYLVKKCTSKMRRVNCRVGMVLKWLAADVSEAREAIRGML